MSITQDVFGALPDGREAHLFTLSNAGGMTVRITDFGGIIVSIETPDRNGVFHDVTLGYDTLTPYLENPVYFGALVGRYANRIGNAEFTLNGKIYRLLKNTGAHHLHGGGVGFNKKLWDAAIIRDGGAEKLELIYVSPDGEEGYPGALRVRVLYSLTEDNAVGIEYFAETDADTVVNLTNHAYFNLAGHDAGPIVDHRLRLHASRFTVTDRDSIPTGEIRPVAGTPMDFTAMRAIGEALREEATYDQLVFAQGHDHNYAIDNETSGIVVAAEAVCDRTGRRLTVLTDQPGVQLYIGNYLSGIVGKGGAVYGKRNAFCLETQHFPDSPNQPGFPTTVLRPGETFRSTTIYKFSTID